MGFDKEKWTDLFFPVDPSKDDETDGEERSNNAEDTQKVNINLNEERANRAETKTSSYEPETEAIRNIPSDAQMVLFEPRSFDEAQQIASYLKSKKACVVNLHRLQREFSQRTIDVLTGVVFALDGSIQKIGHNVILCTPKDVAVTGKISLETDDE